MPRSLCNFAPITLWIENIQNKHFDVICIFKRGSMLHLYQFTCMNMWVDYNVTGKIRPSTSLSCLRGCGQFFLKFKAAGLRHGSLWKMVEFPATVQKMRLDDRPRVPRLCCANGEQLQITIVYKRETTSPPPCCITRPHSSILPPPQFISSTPSWIIYLSHSDILFIIK